MFKEIKSRRLALLVAIALGGGGFLSSAQNVSAADVTGNNVTIDNTQHPSNNVVEPGGISIGSAAGYIGVEGDSGNVTNNTLTFKDRPFPGYLTSLYGGITFGTGNVTGNKVFVQPATHPRVSSARDAYGGVANGGGSVEDNHVTFNGTRLERDLVGGMTNKTGTGVVKKNTATLQGGAVDGDIYGGMAVGDANGNVIENKVFIEDGATGKVYGGFTDGTGKVTGNEVTIKGGTVTAVYGGYTDGTGEVSGNKVNLGDGTGALKAGYQINGTLYGGHSSDLNKVSNNTLNVNANAVAHNIKNFETINFNYNTHMDTTTSLLKLTDSNRTKIKNLSQIHVNGGLLGSGTLIENAHGIDIESYTAAVSRMDEKTETIIDKVGTTKIGYKGYQFKGAHAPQKEGTNTWGGRSILGNTTTDNEITLNGNYDDVYGGWTSGTGSTATGTDAKNHSKGNKITLEGATSQVHNMNGGFTDAAGGNASDNHAILNAGEVNGNLIGGSAEHGDATKNTVEIKDGTVGNSTYGGSAGGTGKAEENTVTLTGGTSDDLHGGFTAGGNAEKNKVFVKGGTAQHVYGASSASGAVTGNTVEISGGTVRDVYGGSSASGAVTGNRVEIGSGGTARNVYGGKASHGNATKNIVEIKGGTVNQSTYGGEAGGTGKAEENTVTLTSGTAGGDIFGGLASSGDATKNTVNINGGSVGSHNVYGAWTTSGNATHNTVTIKGNGGTVQEIIGGRSQSGNATHNTVNLGDGTAPFTTGITGTISGGSGMGSGDYLTGNTLNVHGNAVASNIKNFEKINFHFNDHVNKSAAMLKLSDVGGTTIKSLGDLSVLGKRGYKGTLIEHTGTGTITLSEGPNRVAKTVDDTKELVLAKSTDSKKITYESYIFKGATTPTTDDGGTYKDIFGGRSILGNTTTENTITVSDAVTYRNAYGGWTSGMGTTLTEKGNSIANTITVASTVTDITGTVYGGFTDVAGGNATGNTVTVEKDITGAVVGGKALGEASGNTVTVGNVTVNSITGGDGATTKNNTVNISGTTVTNKIVGGTQTNDTGNTLNVKGMNTAQNIVGFQKVKFDASNVAAGATMLNLSTGTTTLDKSAIDATGSTVNGGITLLENANGITINGLGATDSVVKSETDATTEKNIGVERNGGVIKKVTYEGYQFAGVTTAVPSGTNIYGGISKAGNSTHDNKFTVNDGSGKTVYGGYTTGANGTATDKNDSHTNEVTLTGGTYTNVYGGWTNVGKAVSNTVNVTGNATGSIVGGYSASGEASNNVVSVMNAAFNGDITGGQGTAANYNVIRLRNAAVSGTITGGIAPNVKDNTLEVSYGTGTSSSVNDFSGIQRLHFDMENAPVSNANPLLKLTAVAGGGDKNLTGMKFAVARSGATKKLEKGDTFTLMENTTALGTKITVGSGVTAEGRDGVSRKYEFDITTDATGKLIATVTKAGMGEQSKSIVETRAGASALLNDGADFTAGPGMDAAKKEARAAAQSGNAPYGIWAGMGGGSLRHETGSHVDMKGWNLGVGWARENAVQAGTLTFGPFIEYGRGSYDSYLDDGTHGSGKTSFLGAGVMAKIETNSHWVDGSLRVGRTKSDYTGLASYDTTSTYYGVQVGVGKDLHVNENDTVGVYVRYAYGHTAGTSAHLSSGETFDFDAVNSHRLRLGTRYTHGMSALSQFYAGLAWEYEFDGDARATSQGDSAPSPSLKGGSALLELGYRFAPQGSRMSYDLNLNGWQGKRQGITGGVSVKWAF